MLDMYLLRQCDVVNLRVLAITVVCGIIRQSKNTVCILALVFVRSKHTSNMAACYDDDVNDVISRWFQRLLRQNFTPLNFESLWASCMNVILSIISYAFYE